MIALVFVRNVVLKQKVGNNLFAIRLDIFTTNTFPWQGSTKSQKLFLALVVPSLDDAIPVLTEMGEHQFTNFSSKRWLPKVIVNHLLKRAAQILRFAFCPVVQKAFFWMHDGIGQSMECHYMR